MKVETSDNRGARPGLDGVIACETALSRVDGSRGELIVRGLPIGQLAPRGFGAAVALLLWGDLDRGPDAEHRLAAARRSFEARDLGPYLGSAMDTLRATLARLEGEDDPFRLIALTGLVAPAWARWRQGLSVIAPNPSLSHAADFLYRLRGQPPATEEARALDTYLATVIDHGMNASTFVARVVASTEASLISSLVAGTGALAGRLHGGAPGPVLDMLDAIGSPDRVRPWLVSEIDAGRRIMGLGHRVYRVRDPRAAVLEEALLTLNSGGLVDPRIQLAREVERVAEALLAERKPHRPIRANVEFYTATLLEGLGIDRAIFTATFAAARVAGWCAHVEEQRRHGRLLRPSSRYVGPAAARMRENQMDRR